MAWLVEAPSKWDGGTKTEQVDGKFAPLNVRQKSLNRGLRVWLRGRALCLAFRKGSSLITSTPGKRDSGSGQKEFMTLPLLSLELSFSQQILESLQHARLWALHSITQEPVLCETSGARKK